MGWWVVFGEAIGSIKFAFLPIYVKLVLSHAIAYPVEAHINGFGAFLFDCVIYNAIGCCIVSLDGGAGWG